MAGITYEEIKSRDLGDCLVSGKLTSNAENNLANNQGKLWTNLMGSLENNMDWSHLEEIGSGEDGQKLVRKEIQTYLKKAIIATGAVLEMDEKGKVLWSKDKQTKPIMKYTSDLAKIISFGMAADLFPGDGTVASRCSILKECKVKETSLQAIKRAIGIIDQAMVDADESEYSDILTAFQSLSAHVKTVQSVI